MRPDTAYRDMLRDLVFYFRKIGAQADEERTASGDVAHFEEGRAVAYREVLNSIKNHAIAFGVPADEFGLEDFDPLMDPLALPRELDTDT